MVAPTSNPPEGPPASTRLSHVGVHFGPNGEIKLTAHVPARRDLGKRTSPHGDPLTSDGTLGGLNPSKQARWATFTERWCLHCGAHQLASIEGPLPHAADCPTLAGEDPTWVGADWGESPLSFRNYFAGANFVKLTWVAPVWAYDAAIVANGMGC
jgi:hypothetical protein